MSYNVVWEDTGVKIVTTRVFGDGFLDASINTTTDSRFVNATYAIVDFKNVDEFPVDSETIRQIALSDARAYKLNPGLKLAVLSNGQVMDSLAHMYKVYFELGNGGRAWELKIFESEKQARDWIKEITQ